MKPNFPSKNNRAVIAKITGGLGNQLFIYAAAKRLSLINDAALRLDTSSAYAQDGYNRSYSLNHFRLNAEQASNEDVYTLDLGSRRNPKYHINKILPLRYKYFIRENKLFDPRLLTLKIAHSVYLDGYWQDENYFKDIEATIRKDFEIISPHDHINSELAEEMSQTNAICLHARRLEYEYPLSAEYYDLAIKHMAEKVPNPHFYCFSDDMGWIKNNVTINCPVTYILHNRESKAYEDLWLMTRCKHYIIANSTFSWWGAWLNTLPSKIVIAPRNWGYRAAVPKDWLVL